MTTLRGILALLIIGIFPSSVASQNYFNASYEYVAGTNNTVVKRFGTSTSLPAIYVVAQGPGATGVQIITTPWPIILGQSILSLVLFFFGGTKSMVPWIPEFAWFGFQYLLNTIRCLGAIIFLGIYIAHGGAYPSIGVALVFEGFLILSYPLKQEERSFTTYKFITKRTYVQLLYVGVSIVGIGAILFIASGAIEAVRKHADVPAVVVDITQGCPNGTFPENLATACWKPGPYTYTISPSFTTATLAWWGIGVLLSLTEFLLICKILRNPAEHFARQAFEYKKIALGVMAVGIFLAIGTGGGSAGSLTEQYYDCRNVTQSKNGAWTGCVLEDITWAGSPSGYWNIWSKSTFAVLRGIFAW